MNQRDRKEKVSWSFGGGVQSWSMVAQAMKGKLKWPDVIVFADTVSEHPGTYEFLEKHRESMGELFRAVKPGDYETGVQAGLLETMYSEKVSKIPVKAGTGGYFNRTCTRDWKARRVSKFLRTEFPKGPWKTALGFTFDEVERVRKSDVNWQTFIYPLLDLRMRRSDSVAVCREVFGEVPIKSSCFFCPFHGVLYWRQMEKENKMLFEKVKRLERDIQIWHEDERLKITQGDGQMMLCGGASCWT